MDSHDIYDDYPPPGETWWYDADGVRHDGELPTYPPDQLDAVYPFGYWFDQDGRGHVRASKDDPAELAYLRAMEHRRPPRRRRSLRALFGRGS